MQLICLGVNLVLDMCIFVQSMMPVYIRSLYNDSVMEVGEGVEYNPLDEKRLESQQWCLTDFKDDEFSIISKKNGMALQMKEMKVKERVLKTLKYVKDMKMAELVNMPMKKLELVTPNVADTFQRWKRENQHIIPASEQEDVKMLCVEDNKVFLIEGIDNEHQTLFQLQHIVADSFL